MALEDMEFRFVDIKREGELQSVAEVTAQIGTELPQRWLNFIEKHKRPTFFDGQIDTLEEMTFLSRGITEVYVIYGLNSGNFGITETHATYNGRVMNGLVPIASPGPHGDQIFCALGPIETGKVFYWWHEANVPENSRKSLCLLANSVDEFFDRIEPSEEYSQPV